MAPNPACKTFIPMLSPFIDGELSAAERGTVELHLSACQACASRIADLRAEAGLIRVGLEMVADEVDFSGFTQKVMARITPDRPPLLERLKLAASEFFTYQRGALVTGLVAAAVVGLVLVPLLSRERYPEGYAQQHMQLQSVSVNPDAHVSPVVLYTEKGDAIILLTDHPDHDAAIKAQQSGKAPGSDAEDEEEGVSAQKKQGTPNSGKPLEQQHPTGGEL